MYVYECMQTLQVLHHTIGLLCKQEVGYCVIAESWLGNIYATKSYGQAVYWTMIGALCITQQATGRADNSDTLYEGGDLAS